MKLSTTFTAASLATLATAAQDQRTFAVLRFIGDGFLSEGPVDPIVNPGTIGTHYHSIMGGRNFGPNTTGDDLLSSSCTTAMIKNDKSNYWINSLFFQDPKNGTFQKVPPYYMNVYYFFEPTDDEIKPFPVGLKMMTGDPKKRSPPASGALNLDPNAGPINAIQWTCPRTSYDPPSYPVGSDGSMAGMVDPNNQGSGAGFPLYPCDGFASPLRQDMHFPSCYNPAVGLDDYENNMAFPTVVNWKQNCPEGWIHVPHIFYEVYWNTPAFNDYWTPDGKTQPFVLSTGDVTGYSSHGDFLGGWDLTTLETIINTCNAGDIGMDKCPNIPGGLNDNNNCKVGTAFGEILQNGQILDELPVVGKDVTGFGRGGVDSPPAGSTAPSRAPAQPAVVVPAQSAESSNTGFSSTQDSVQPTAVVPTHSAESSNTGFSHPQVPKPQAATPTPDTFIGADGIETVMDIVTVTTTVVVTEPTQPVRRHAHGHAARHAADHHH